jgi:hypothetical protein
MPALFPGPEKPGYPEGRFFFPLPQTQEKTGAAPLLTPEADGFLFNPVYGFIYRGSIIRRPGQEGGKSAAPDVLYPDEILHDTGLST